MTRSDDDVLPGDALGAVRRLLDEPELLRLAAQPVVDVDAGTAAGYELLARAPESWLVTPDALFSVAHDLGVSTALNERVVAEAVRLRDTLPDNTFLTVNVDPPDLTDDGVLDVLLGAASLDRIVIELTEHAWPEHDGRILEALAEIRGKGGLIAADDVGVGYSGLAQLMRLRPEFVKLDRVLTAAIGRDPAAEALVSAVGRLSSSLDAWVIVEGVETEEQFAVLDRLEVPLAQGWLFGRPGPPWPELHTVDLLRRRAASGPSDGTLLTLLRPVSTPYRRDEYGRYHRDGESLPCLTCAPATPLRDAVERALARPDDQRWTPILVTDQQGRIAGEVTLEDLVAAVAR